MALSNPAQEERRRCPQPGALRRWEEVLRLTDAGRSLDSPHNLGMRHSPRVSEYGGLVVAVRPAVTGGSPTPLPDGQEDAHLPMTWLLVNA